MSWEDEFDEIDVKEEKEKNKNVLSNFNDESEEIIVTQKVKQETIRQKDKPIDYEKKISRKKKS